MRKTRCRPRHYTHTHVRPGAIYNWTNARRRRRRRFVRNERNSLEFCPIHIRTHIARIRVREPSSPRCTVTIAPRKTFLWPRAGSLFFRDRKKKKTANGFLSRFLFLFPFPVVVTYVANDTRKMFVEFGPHSFADMVDFFFSSTLTQKPTAFYNGTAVVKNINRCRENKTYRNARGCNIISVCVYERVYRRKRSVYYIGRVGPIIPDHAIQYVVSIDGNRIEHLFRVTKRKKKKRRFYQPSRNNVVDLFKYKNNKQNGLLYYPAIESEKPSYCNSLFFIANVLQ